MAAQIKRMLYRGLYGLCIGLVIVAFYKYIWDFVRPFFISDSMEATNKMLLFGIFILLDIVIAIWGITYERKIFKQSLEKDGKTIAIRIVFLVGMIIFSALAFSLVFEIV